MTTTTMFHPLRVRSIAPDTAEAVVVSFDVPPALREVFGFTQGQYLTLRHQIDGQDLRRSYSICAGMDDGELRVGVRKVRGGQFSNWINEHLRPGDTLQVMAPQGRFFVPIEPGAARHHVGIAGGSGITPILSIMKTVLAREPASRFTLIYGNRQLQSTMFKEEIEDLKNRYMSRLSLQHVFSDEHTDLPLNMGVMDRTKIAEFLQGVVPAAHIDHVYICGPFQMNDEAEAALLAAGVPRSASTSSASAWPCRPQARARWAPWCTRPSPATPPPPASPWCATASRARSPLRAARPASWMRPPRPGWKCPIPAPRASAAPAAPRWSRARCAWSATSPSTRMRSPAALS